MLKRPPHSLLSLFLHKTCMLAQVIACQQWHPLWCPMFVVQTSHHPPPKKKHTHTHDLPISKEYLRTQLFVCLVVISFRLYILKQTFRMGYLFDNFSCLLPKKQAYWWSKPRYQGPSTQTDYDWVLMFWVKGLYIDCHSNSLDCDCVLDFLDSIMCVYLTHRIDNC